MELLLILHKLFIQMNPLNPLKGVFSDKPLIIADISNFKFTEILNS